MTVLVAVASKHRSTLEIAQSLGRAIADHGIPTDVLPAGEVDDVVPYEAVVLGSGVYAGNWLAPARDLVARCATHLQDRPVWLFSSGPMGDPPLPPGDPAGVAPLIELLRPRGHRVFAGRLDRRDLGLGEKLIFRAVRAPYGDFRDWHAVASWAAEIAVALRPPRREGPERAEGAEPAGEALVSA
jgi:menaquinone-dependent protoporphyrinogen oxidase